MKNINRQFQIVQSAQVVLLIAQGILLIVNGTNELSLVIWALMGVSAILQVLIILQSPKKIEMNQLVDRSAMIKLRLFATLPYILIILGILHTR